MNEWGNWEEEIWGLRERDEAGVKVFPEHSLQGGMQIWPWASWQPVQRGKQIRDVCEVKTDHLCLRSLVIPKPRSTFPVVSHRDNAMWGCELCPLWQEMYEHVLYSVGDGWILIESMLKERGRECERGCVRVWADSPGHVLRLCLSRPWQMAAFITTLSTYWGFTVPDLCKTLHSVKWFLGQGERKECSRPHFTGGRFGSCVKQFAQGHPTKTCLVRTHPAHLSPCSFCCCCLFFGILFHFI